MGPRLMHRVGIGPLLLIPACHLLVGDALQYVDGGQVDGSSTMATDRSGGRDASATILEGGVGGTDRTEVAAGFGGIAGAGAIPDGPRESGGGGALGGMVGAGGRIVDDADGSAAASGGSNTGAGGSRAIDAGKPPMDGGLGDASKGAGGAQAGGAGGASKGSGGTPGAGGATVGGRGGAGQGGTSACPGSGGSPMVRVPEGYCIDVTEVSRGQYDLWLASNPSVMNQDSSNCSWNTTFALDSTCLATSSVCPTRCENEPAVCMDWCDAVAYCRAVGKRLCGKSGGGSAPYAASDASSQWYNACTSGGVNTYVYGNQYVANACNGAEKGIRTTTRVGTESECQSSVTGYRGVFDLLGNAYEWEDACDGPGRTSMCRVRGGSYEVSSFLQCSLTNYSGTTMRSFVGHDLGFRCCSE